MGCSVQQMFQLFSTGGLFSFLYYLLPLHANMLFNQMKTNSANSIKFIGTFFKQALNTNFLIFNFLFEIWYENKMVTFKGTRASLLNDKGTRETDGNTHGSNLIIWKEKSTNHKVFFLSHTEKMAILLNTQWYKNFPFGSYVNFHI